MIKVELVKINNTNDETNEQSDSTSEENEEMDKIITFLTTKRIV